MAAAALCVAAQGSGGIYAATAAARGPAGVGGTLVSSASIVRILVIGAQALRLADALPAAADDGSLSEYPLLHISSLGLLHRAGGQKNFSEMSGLHTLPPHARQLANTSEPKGSASASGHPHHSAAPTSTAGQRVLPGAPLPEAAHSEGDGHKCPGTPECSSHGVCRLLPKPSASGEAHGCKCSIGWFGRDCSHKERECAQLRSCAECQDTANRAFCGWCAIGHYCVPKHIHHALVKRDKACPAWYEDTCPQSAGSLKAAANMSHGGGGAHAGKSNGGGESDGPDSYVDLAGVGDESSVLLAEALESWMEEGSKRRGGPFSWILTLIMLVAVVISLRCFVHEVRAARERARFEEYMAGEAGLKRDAGPALTPASPHAASNRGGGAHLLANAAAIIDALGPCSAAPPSSEAGELVVSSSVLNAHDPGLGSPSETLRRMGAPGKLGEGTSSQLEARAEEMARQAAEEMLLQEAIREAARLDLEERKRHRRRQAEDAKGEAERETVAIVAQKASKRLEERVQKGGGEEQPDTPDAVRGDGSAPPPALVPAHEKTAAAEADFLAALEEL